MRIVDIIRQVAPGAASNYLAAFEAGDALLAQRGINSPLRISHLLAQFLHETGGMTIQREDMSYRADRILQVFGKGKHSAAVSSAEAKKLAGNGAALAERVYGLGNPAMAKDLGNTQAGDGWRFRGNGLNQGTGRGFHARASKATGIDFVGNPELATDATHALAFALVEWDDTFLRLSDQNDILAITKRLNGGTNGYAERVAWFNKVYAVAKVGDAPAWQAANASDATTALQRDLNTLGYGLAIDGKLGPKTAEAVAAFQKANGLRVDGVAGPLTLAAINLRLSGGAAAPAPLLSAPPAAPPVAGGVSTAAIAGMAQEFIDKSQLLQPYVHLSRWVEYACGGLVAVGIGIALVGVVRTFVIPILHKPAPPVAA